MTQPDESTEQTPDGTASDEQQDTGGAADRVKQKIGEAAAAARDKLPGGGDGSPSPSGPGAPGYVHNDEVEAEHQQD
ncbi:hypothetical protein FHX74_003571 [Friedmanniella endophytica]|uniref:Uncharacterized protein n=1 Tax=Microlunatus kandeliicorticis TaxID=1759536 RepID=A0A7W3P7F4_9ACTN|nr:hypothetical protein [Microlunatus kandeliicorticis]MBA8795930.1 hypothetical protein [Microlunatus kandeliicorticis]